MSDNKENKIKLITFDLDNTLWDVDPVIKSAEKILLGWIAKHHPDAKEFFSPTEIMKLKKEVALKQPLLIYRLTDFRKTTIKLALKKAGYSDQAAHIESEKAFDIFFEARNQVDFFPGALNTLQILSRTYKIGSLSNGNACIIKTGLDNYVSFHFSAEKIGQAKPHPALFEAALKEADVLPHECIHIGDHPEQDILAAADLGMTTVWANFFNMQWPYEDEPAFQITHFDQLIKTIQSIDPR